MNRFVILVSSLAGATFLGCTVGPDYAPPTTAMPDHFGEYLSASEATTRPATMPSTQAVSGQVERWWENFRDPQLNNLIERAVQSNLDLKAAEARIRQARAQYGVMLANEFPLVTARGSATRSRGSTGVGSRSSSSSAFTPTAHPNNLYQAAFDASWEIDVFGGVRRGVEAAEHDIEAAVEDRHNVLLTLISEVARDYVDYRGFARQIEIAKENVAAQEETLAVTRRQFEAGLKTATELDVARAQALVFSTQSQIPALETSLRQTAHAIAILLGKEPNALTQELGASRPIPSAVIPVVPIGLPSDLLRRRPDIRRAERQLAAATARIGVATADLFPKFSLTGSLGLESSKFKDIANYGSHFWSIGPSVSWPVLDFGKIRANIRVQNALQEQAMTAYESAVLIALGEVEDTLVAYGREQVRRQDLSNSVGANRRAVSLARQRYDAGLTDFLSVLDAERSLYAAQDQLIQSDRLVSTNLVALYKALGGGWESLEPQARQAAVRP